VKNNVGAKVRQNIYCSYRRKPTPRQQSCPPEVFWIVIYFIIFSIFPPKRSFAPPP